MNDLRNWEHLFENCSELPSTQTNPLVMMNYLLQRDFYSNDLSIV